MITFNTIKANLLSTKVFINNNYLDKYINLIINQAEVSNFGYSEKHHLIPVSYYRWKYKCKSRYEALKLADQDALNLLVSLPYKDHCLAHCLLYFCTYDRLKQDSAVTVQILMGHFNKIVNSNTDYQEIWKYISEIKNDPKNNYFTKEEDEFLILNYFNLGSTKCAKILNRAVGSVSYRAKYLGLKSKINYTEEQKKFLRKNYALYGAKYCAEYLGRTVEAIQKYAEATLKLKGKSKAIPIYCVDLNIMFSSATEASTKLGISRSAICNALNCYSKTAGGYTWIYYERMLQNEERKSEN